MVRVPTVEEEVAERLHRERARLIRERVGHVNRIRNLCTLDGIFDYRPCVPTAWSSSNGFRPSKAARFHPG